MKLTFCLTSLLVPFLITGCNQSEQEAARKEMQNLREEVATMKQEVARSAADAKTARQSMEDTRREAEAKEKKFNDDRDALQRDLEKTSKAYEEYKSKFRLSARRKATGQSMPLLNCGGGKVYADVKILGITAGEVRFQHADGSSKVALGRLEQDLRDRLGYDAQEALAWQEDQDKIQLQREKQEQDRKRAELASQTSEEDYTAAAASSKANYTNSARRGYQDELASLYASARALQADRTGCPVHKRYQLDAWSAQADRLKEKIAALPAAR